MAEDRDEVSTILYLFRPCRWLIFDIVSRRPNHSANRTAEEEEPGSLPGELHV